MANIFFVLVLTLDGLFEESERSSKMILVPSCSLSINVRSLSLLTFNPVTVWWLISRVNKQQLLPVSADRRAWRGLILWHACRELNVHSWATRKFEIQTVGETGFKERLRIEIRLTGCCWTDRGKGLLGRFIEEKENGLRQIFFFFLKAKQDFLRSFRTDF